MIGLGTIVNALAILVGGTLGLFFKQRLKEKYKVILMQALGLSTLIVGITGAVNNINNLPDVFILEMTVFLVLGTVLGTYLKIEERLNGFAEKMQTKFAKYGNFAKGFVSASIVYCVGAMAITGSLDDGLGKGYSILFTKSVLDGVSAMVFASTLGVGVIFSAIPIIIYQGSITFAASLLESVLVKSVVSQMSAVGSILIIGISFNLLEIKKINVANMLPAIFLPILYYIILMLFNLL